MAKLSKSFRSKSAGSHFRSKPQGRAESCILSIDIPPASPITRSRVRFPLDSPETLSPNETPTLSIRSYSSDDEEGNFYTPRTTSKHFSPFIWSNTSSQASLPCLTFPDRPLTVRNPDISQEISYTAGSSSTELSSDEEDKWREPLYIDCGYYNVDEQTGYPYFVDLEGRYYQVDPWTGNPYSIDSEGQYNIEPHISIPFDWQAWQARGLSPDRQLTVRNLTHEEKIAQGVWHEIPEPGLRVRNSGPAVTNLQSEVVWHEIREEREEELWEMKRWMELGMYLLPVSVLMSVVGYVVGVGLLNLYEMLGGI